MVDDNLDYRSLSSICGLIKRGAAPSYIDNDGMLVLNQKCVRDERINLDEARRTNIKNKPVSPERTLQSFDILVNSTGVGTLGRVAQIIDLPESATVDSHVTIVRADPSEVLPHFLGFVLRGAQREIEYLARGSTGQTELARELLGELKVPIPPRDEQIAIAHILGALDDKIELNRRMNEALEAMARAIFKSWFVDFDPVIDNAIKANNPIPDSLGEKVARRKEFLARAEVEGRMAGLPSDLAAMFPDAFEIEDGEGIPSGWRFVELSTFVEINPRRKIQKNENSAYLEMKNMPTKGPRPIKWTNRRFRSGTRFINGDTLIARITPCLENGKTAYVNFLEKGQVGWGSTEYIVIRPRDPVPTEYAYYLARGDGLRKYAIQNMTGTSGRQRVSASVLGEYSVVKPPDPLLGLFGITARQVIRSITANDEENRTLTAIRDNLLPMLISGKLKVKA